MAQPIYLRVLPEPGVDFYDSLGRFLDGLPQLQLSRAPEALPRGGHAIWVIPNGVDIDTMTAALLREGLVPSL